MSSGAKFASDMVIEVEAAKASLIRSFRMAARMLADEMRRPLDFGGSMPVDTGYLRYSLEVSTTGIPQVRSVPESGAPQTSRFGAAMSVISRARPESVLYFAFTAPYAARINYGFTGMDSLGRMYNQSGRHFYERGLSMWPELVSRASAIEASLGLRETAE